jgi:hypothetical protein
MPQANPRAIRLINALQAEGNEAEQNAAFAELMREKVAVALDARKVALTPEMFGEAVVSPKSPKKSSAPIPYDGNGVEAGKTYAFETGPVTVVQLDRGIVVYQRKEKPGTMKYQLQRMQQDEFQDRLLTEGADPVRGTGLSARNQHSVTTGKSYKIKSFSAIHNRNEEISAKVIKTERDGPGGKVFVTYQVGNTGKTRRISATLFIAKIIKEVD